MECSEAHFQVEFLVNTQPWRKDVPHHEEVGLLVIHSETIHAKVLGQQRLAVTVDYVLKRRKTKRLRRLRNTFIVR